MPECPLRIALVWECPLCLRQSAVLEGESDRPYVCALGHRQVEMEQRSPEAFQAQRQHINWAAGGR